MNYSKIEDLNLVELLTEFLKKDTDFERMEEAQQLLGMPSVEYEPTEFIERLTPVQIYRVVDKLDIFSKICEYYDAHAPESYYPTAREIYGDL